MMVKINLKREDFQTFQFLNITSKLAFFLMRNQEYLRSFIPLLRNSYKYDVHEFHQKICGIQNMIERKRVPSESDGEYIFLLSKLSDTCRIKSDVNDLRGMMAEQIFQECFKQRKLGRDWTWLTGCSVWIDGVLILYSSGIESKKTVDLGAWCFNLQSGEFYEVKLSPYAFHEVDFHYLEHLHQSLENAGISKYKIAIFSLDDSLLLRKRIEELGFQLLDRMQLLSLRELQKRGFL